MTSNGTDGSDAVTRAAVTTGEPRLDEERERVALVFRRAGSVEVRTAEDNADAAKILEEIKGRARDMEALRKSMTRPIMDAKLRIDNLFRPIEEQLADAEQHVKGAMLAFHRQEQRRLDAERAAAEAERRRLEAEASKAAQEGRLADAAAAAEESFAVPEPPRAPVRAAGTGVLTTWHAEVVDIQALLLAVATGEAPIGLVKADEQALNALARATKIEGIGVPGVRFYKQDSMRGRAGGLR
ncbi:MAG: hypothetical protein NUW01_18685 [Gemmatimonadaceae bacterium]|nr:hypothetical protein [Gemmatimonadaceae bacterium]